MTRDELYNFWRFEETFPFSGWDFAHLDGRWEQEPLPWDFYAEVQRRLHYADQLLEVDTGGAFLLSLRHPYENTAATETWGPNVESYRNELAPLGIHVEECDAAEEPLPFADNAFDVAFCRHGAYRADELLRVLRPGGVFLTEQVGGRNNALLARRLLRDYRPLARSIICPQIAKPLRMPALSCWMQRNTSPNFVFMIPVRSYITRT